MWLPPTRGRRRPRTHFHLTQNGILIGLLRTSRAIFANQKLKCNLDKAPDFIAKVKQKYVIGEAKFLTDYGGHQYAQLQDALRLLNQHEGEALRVAILDGVVWIKNSAKMHRTVSVLNKPAFTALLLKEFLLSLS